VDVEVPGVEEDEDVLPVLAPDEEDEEPEVEVDVDVDVEVDVVVEVADEEELLAGFPS